MTLSNGTETMACIWWRRSSHISFYSKKKREIIIVKGWLTDEVNAAIIVCIYSDLERERG
jgi:hypothetical protein